MTFWTVFFLLVQMSSIFACGLCLHRKTDPPISVRLFLFHFTQIVYAKTQFFPSGILSKQSFCFSKQQNQQSAHLPPGLVQENLHFCTCYFSKTKNKTAEKIAGQRFPIKSKVTCKNLTHLEAKKNPGLKSHLRY